METAKPSSKLSEKIVDAIVADLKRLNVWETLLPYKAKLVVREEWERIVQEKLVELIAECAVDATITVVPPKPYCVAVASGSLDEIQRLINDRKADGYCVHTFIENGVENYNFTALMVRL